MLIFEDAIFSIWNQSFYCSFRRADFITVFVFKIGPFLVVGITILPPQIIRVLLLWNQQQLSNKLTFKQRRLNCLNVLRNQDNDHRILLDFKLSDIFVKLSELKLGGFVSCCACLWVCY